MQTTQPSRLSIIRSALSMAISKTSSMACLAMLLPLIPLQLLCMLSVDLAAHLAGREVSFRSRQRGYQSLNSTRDSDWPMFI